MNNRRTGKFYRRNEAEVMEQLGLTPTKGSGSGWLEKEDGYNDTILCQLKSTDAESITVKQHDLHTLLYNSIVSHKLPVFAIQFLNTDEVWIMAKSDDLMNVANGLQPYKQRKPWEGMAEYKDGEEIGHMDEPGRKGCPGPAGTLNPVIIPQPPKPLISDDVERGISEYFHMYDDEQEELRAEMARRSVQSSPKDREMFYKQQKGWMNKNAE